VNPGERTVYWSRLTSERGKLGSTVDGWKISVYGGGGALYIERGAAVYGGGNTVPGVDGAVYGWERTVYRGESTVYWSTRTAAKIPGAVQERRTLGQNPEHSIIWQASLSGPGDEHTVPAPAVQSSYSAAPLDDAYHGMRHSGFSTRLRLSCTAPERSAVTGELAVWSGFGRRAWRMWVAPVPIQTSIVFPHILRLAVPCGFDVGVQPALFTPEDPKP